MTYQLHLRHLETPSQPTGLAPLRLQIARKLHSHENPRRNERHDDEDEAHGYEQNFVQLRFARRVRLVHDDEAESSDREQEAAGKPLHDVLTIYPVRHERDRPRMSMLVRRRTDARWLNDHVVNNAYKR